MCQWYVFSSRSSARRYWWFRTTDDDNLNHPVKDQKVLLQYILVINTNHLDGLELKMMMIFSKSSKWSILIHWSTSLKFPFSVYWFTHPNYLFFLKFCNIVLHISFAWKMTAKTLLTGVWLLICKKNPIFSQREYKKSTNSRKASPCSAWSAFLMPKAMLDSYRVWTKQSYLISWFFSKSKI